MERTVTSICALLVEEKRFVEKFLTQTLSHWQVSVSEFDIKHLGMGTSDAIVTFRAATLRGWSRSFKFQFSQIPRFVDPMSSYQAKTGGVFAYLMDDSATVKSICRRIRREVGCQMSGYRRELIALRYYEKIAAISPEIKAIRISTAEEDTRAIDLVIRVKFDGHEELDVPVQVKSGRWPDKKHRDDPVKGLVPSVAIPKTWTFDKLWPQMRALLRVYVLDKKILHVSVELSLSFVRK